MSNKSILVKDKKITASFTEADYTEFIERAAELKYRPSPLLHKLVKAFLKGEIVVEEN